MRGDPIGKKKGPKSGHGPGAVAVAGTLFHSVLRAWKPPNSGPISKCFAEILEAGGV